MMGLLTRLLLLPVSAPTSASLWIARQIADCVERERSSPSALREALRAAEAGLLAGELSEAEYDAIETELLERIRDA